MKKTAKKIENTVPIFIFCLNVFLSRLKHSQNEKFARMAPRLSQRRFFPIFVYLPDFVVRGNNVLLIPGVTPNANCERNTTLRVSGISLFRNFSDSCRDSEGAFDVARANF